MKKVLILYGKKGVKKPPFENDSYRISYEILYTLCEERGIKMYRAPYQEYDHKKKYFKRAWFFDAKHKYWGITKNVIPHLIFDKTSASSQAYYEKELIGKDYLFFNALEFSQLVRNKLAISLLFSKWSKKSWLIENKRDLKKILPKIATEKLVIKPLRGGGGKSVQVLEKKNALKNARIKGPYLIQDYIDSSAGISGVSKSMHDFRLVMINDKIIYSFVREPKAGCFLANCSQGGLLKIVSKKSIPKSVYPIINHAKKMFSTFSPRFYSIDLMFDRTRRPWVVELNAMPGLNICAEEEKPHILRLYKELLRIFKEKTNDTSPSKAE